MHTPPAGVASPPSREPAWLARSRGIVSNSHRSFFSSPSRLAHDLAQSSPDPVEADVAVRELWHAQEAVHLTDGATVVHRDRGSVKVLRVGLALVAEHIVLRGEDHSGGEALGHRGPQWGDVGIRSALNIRNVLVPEPLHRAAVEEELVLRVE